MGEEEERESLMIYLKKELEESLARNESIEKEITDLRQEVIRLKAQITSLKAHDNDRKSLLWRKLQNSNESLTKNGESKSPEIRQQPLLNPPIKLPPISSAPPPPPPPLKMCGGSKPVRRVPEVVEFYRMLSRKNANMEQKSKSGAIAANAFTCNMIGEIENRSTHLSAIKSDVEKQKEMISELMKEVENAAFKDINDVEAFVKWLDEQLSSLVDERAVLKHFTKWPEMKSDALREAAFNYRDLHNLHSLVLSFHDDPNDTFSKASARMHALQDRLETSVNGIERTRDSLMKKYKDFNIPWAWLMDSGLIGQMKLSSLKVGKEYMRRIVKEVQKDELSGDANYLLQGARFAHRIHQFAGGFDTETIDAFHEMKNMLA